MAGKKMYIGEDFKTSLARISYANGLYTPRDDKHSVTLIYPKSDIAALQNAVADVVKNEWSEKGIERFKKGLIKNPILAGDGKSAHDKEGNLRDGMGPEVVFIRPWSKDPIKCFGPDVLPMDAKDVKSGWWGYPVLTPFAWHNDEQGDGVGFWISMWQHIKEDEVFAGSREADPDKFFQKEKVETDGDGNVGSGGASDLFN